MVATPGTSGNSAALRSDDASAAAALTAPARPSAGNRVFNFSAGPSCLPLPVLERVQRELLSHGGCGMSVMEMSHRGKEFRRIYDETIGSLRALLEVPESHDVFFLHGGASAVFAALPLNFAGGGGSAKSGGEARSMDYILTGSWGQRACEEALKFGPARVLARGQERPDGPWSFVPAVEAPSPDAAFVHYCANETVMGVEYPWDFGLPNCRGCGGGKGAPEKAGGDDAAAPLLIADMSSNFCSRRIPHLAEHDVIYAGVQKNLAPAAAAAVIARREVLAQSSKSRAAHCPSVMDFSLTAQQKSAYNTPNCWSIYLAGLVARHLLEAGGADAANDRAEARARLLYGKIDSSGGFYASPVRPRFRSRVNAPFTVNFGDEATAAEFAATAAARGLVALAGHRSVGGCRASMYNAMPAEGVVALCDFMDEFRETHEAKERNYACPPNAYLTSVLSAIGPPHQGRAWHKTLRGLAPIYKRICSNSRGD